MRTATQHNEPLLARPVVVGVEVAALVSRWQHTHMPIFVTTSLRALSLLPSNFRRGFDPPKKYRNIVDISLWTQSDVRATGSGSY
jgi:hypothetical protein